MNQRMWEDRAGRPDNRLRRAARVLGPLAAAMAAVWLFAPSGPLVDSPSYLVFHSVVEVFTIVVAAMVFAVGWHANRAHRPGNVLLISCIFLMAGLIDLGHLLSHQGMTNLVTLFSRPKAIYFSLARQLVVSGGLLLAVLLPPRPFADARTRAVLFGGGLTLAVLVYWVVLFHLPALPEVLSPDGEPTAFRVGMGVAVVLLYTAIIALLLFRPSHFRPRLAGNLLLAMGTAVLAEICFTLHANQADAYNLLGHIYVVAAYVFIYRGVFVDSIREPAELLEQSRDALSSSEERFRDLVESSSEEIWELRVDLVVTYISPKVKDLLGYSPNEVVGRSLLDFMSAEEAKRIKSVAEAIMAEGHPFSFLQYKKLHKDGRELIFEASGVPFFDDDGRLLGYRGVSREVTEQRRAEEKLHQWAQIFEYAHWGVAVTDNQGRLKLMNRAYAEMHGWSVDELNGRSVEEVIAPEDHAALGDHIRLLDQVDERQVFESRHLRRDGTVFDARVDVAAVKDEAGKILYCISHVADISEQKRAEVALREREQRLSLVLEGSDNLFWDWDVATDEVFLSSSWAKVLGYTGNELEIRTGAEWFQLVHPDDMARLGDALYPHVEGRIPKYEAEYRVRVKSGEWRWHVGRGKVVARDEQGRPLRMTGTNRDIHARKVAEEKLQKWAHIFEHAEWGVAVCDLDGRISMVNPYLAQSRGYTADELVGRAVAELFAQPFCREMLSECSRIVDEMGHHSFESRHVHKDGTVFPVRIYAKAVKDEKGQVLYRVAHMKDITEQKKVEDALRKSESLLAEAQKIAHLGSWEWDIEQNEFYWSDEVYRIFGQTRDSFTPSLEALMAFVHPDDQAVVNDLMTQALFDKRPYSADFRIILPDGMERFLHGRTEVVSWCEEGGAPHVMGVFQDVTQQKGAEHELKRSRQRLRELSAFLQTIREEERTGIARNVHDQLGQVLTALKMDIAWVGAKLEVDSSTPLARKTAAMSGVIDRAIDTVRNIVSDLRPVLLDDMGLAAAIEWHTQEFEEQTGVECHLNLCEDDLFLEGGRATSIFRIVQECLTNVAKHARASRVEVSLRRRGSLLVLTVRDDGIGFEPVSLRKMTSFGVLGMKERAVMLNGRLRIRNMPGRGTIVTAAIPLEIV